MADYFDCLNYFNSSGEFQTVTSKTIFSYFNFKFIRPPNAFDYSKLESVDMHSVGTIVTVLVIINLLYWLLQRNCRYWDRVDFFMYKKAIQINGIPTGDYQYLITIHTNWRPGSGTTAKVFLELEGTFGKSVYCYFLHNPYRPYRSIFHLGDISWFQLNTCHPFGDLTCIRLFHDNTGNSPSWYLSKVVIKDMQTQKTWRFLAYSWISNTHQSVLDICSITLKTVDPTYSESFGEKVFEWARRCFRERPLTSYFYLSLIHDVSRSQQLSVTYFYILSLMLINIAYYDQPEFFFSFETLLNIAIKSTVIMLVLIVLKYITERSTFTKHTPSKNEIKIRVLFHIVLYSICLIEIILIILYSTNFKEYQSFYWLFFFIGGLIKNETIDSTILSILKAVLYTFLARDPYTEESAKVRLTSKIY